MYPRSTIKSYKGGGVNPVGAEQPFIYKDPPKAIFTRKYEPVNEFEIQTFIRPDSEYADPSRVNESIKYFARGQNPMVEVSYSNAGGAQTNSSLGNFQASNPYKIEVVRPPMYPIETMVPISAPRIHQNYSIHTNPSIAPTSLSSFYDKNSVRKTTVDSLAEGVVRVNPSLDYLNISADDKRDTYTTGVDTLKGSIRPTMVVSIDPTRDMNTLRKTAVKESVMNIAVNTASSFNNIIVVDSKTNTSVNVMANIKDKKYIAIQAAAGLPIVFNTADGKEIKLKNYTYSVINSNVNNNQLVIQVKQPDIKLERNIPLYSGHTNINISHNNKGIDKLREVFDNIVLDDRIKGSSSTNISLPGYNGDIDRQQLDTFNLQSKQPLTSVNTNVSLKGYDDWGARGNQNTIHLNKLSVFGDTGDRNFSNGRIGDRPDIQLSGVKHGKNIVDYAKDMSVNRDYIPSSEVQTLIPKLSGLKKSKTTVDYGIDMSRTR